MSYPGRILMRLLERRAVSDRLRIENHHVREHSCPKETSLFKAEVRRRQAAEASNSFLQIQKLFFPDILSQNTREISVGARMRIRFQEIPFRRLRSLIGAE